MVCEICQEDPQPNNFANTRRCAFDELGMFNSDNWMCGLLCKLRQCLDEPQHYSDDQNLFVFPYDGAFILLGVYKSRGRTEQAVVVDGERTYPLTQEFALEVLNYYET